MSGLKARLLPVTLWKRDKMTETQVPKERTTKEGRVKTRTFFLPTVFEKQMNMCGGATSSDDVAGICLSAFHLKDL